MTRINVVPPAELSDQHLLAEYREIQRIPAALEKSLRAHGGVTDAVVAKIPKAYCVGSGHVYFFYNKGTFLRNRFAALCKEMAKRGMQVRYTVYDPQGKMHAPCWSGTYKATKEARALNQTRLRARWSEKPQWYRWTQPSQRPNWISLPSASTPRSTGAERVGSDEAGC